jgi:hypothetical protein
VKRNGFGYARTRLLSYFSDTGMFNEQTGGMEYYWFVSNLVKNFDEQADLIIANLTRTAGLLFSKNNLIVQATCARSDQSAFNKDLKNFVKTLPTAKAVYQPWTFQLSKKNEALMSASKVQYVLQGYDYKKLGYNWNGSIRVLNQILSTDWLQNQIRVIGGAYGGFSYFAPNGQVYFASYRDPNLKETLDNYNATPQYLHNFEAGQQTMTRYIIGTIAELDQPLTPSQQGNLAARNYLEKRNREQIQQERAAVLAVTAQDIKNMEKMVADILAQQAYCVYGNEEIIKMNENLFGKVLPLSQ